MDRQRSGIVRLAILKGQEIIGIMPVTKVPRMPEFVRGDNWAVPAGGKTGHACAMAGAAQGHW